MEDIEKKLETAKLKPPPAFLDERVEALFSQHQEKNRAWFQRPVPLWVAVLGFAICGWLGFLISIQLRSPISRPALAFVLEDTTHTRRLFGTSESMEDKPFLEKRKGEVKNLLTKGDPS